MKKIISVLLIVMMITSSIMPVSAATYTTGAIVGTVVSKTPTNVFYKDLIRFEEVATNTYGKQSRIINATRYNGSATTWIVRLEVGSGEDKTTADYVLNVTPYSKDLATNQIVSVPANGNIQEGVAMYGPSWFYFGIFDDVKHDLCGFMVAERIRRYSAWGDLRFNGTNKRGITYTGSYPENSSSNFLEGHIESVQ